LGLQQGELEQPGGIKTPEYPAFAFIESLDHSAELYIVVDHP
jgi:hypothetical protein